MDWRQWHQRYDDPDSLLSRRLKVVQAYVRAALDGAPAGVGVHRFTGVPQPLVKGRSLFSFVPGGA